VDDQTSAAIGSTTTSDRNAVTNPRGTPADARPHDRPQTAGTATALGGARGGPPDRLLDPDHAALRGLEAGLVGCAPAAARLVGDREQAGPGRELPREVLRGGGVHRPEAVLPEHLL